MLSHAIKLAYGMNGIRACNHSFPATVTVIIHYKHFHYSVIIHIIKLLSRGDSTLATLLILAPLFVPFLSQPGYIDGPSFVGNAKLPYPYPSIPFIFFVDLGGIFKEADVGGGVRGVRVGVWRGRAGACEVESLVSGYNKSICVRQQEKPLPPRSHLKLPSFSHSQPSRASSSSERWHSESALPSRL